MPLPKKGKAIDEERATRQIRHAIDQGVNYLDTSWMYGNEAVIGRVLADGYREKVNIATRAPLFLIRAGKDLDKLLDEQLHNLQTDHIDYYGFHALPASTSPPASNTITSWASFSGLS